MASKAFRSAMLGLFLVASSSVFATGASAEASGHFERGFEHYEQSRYTAALADFRLAADAGDARAQEVLGFMYFHGARLYGSAVPESRSEAARWFGMAAGAGRPVAQYMVCVLADRPAGTAADRAKCSAGPRQALAAPTR